jgi:spore germination cell wall hydrolase CwlJ-like protein
LVLILESYKRLVRSRRSFAAPLLIGAAVFLSFPTATAFQDMASLISGSEAGASRWHAFLKPAAAGSVHQAEMQFADDHLTTGSIAGAGVDKPGIGTVALSGKSARLDARPDEERINRTEKRSRIASVSTTAPPKAFTAGSILERQSMILRPTLPGDIQMAFTKARFEGNQIQVAQVFYKKEIKKAAKPKLSNMIAELADDKSVKISANAYAPVEPDYSTDSPFQSLLNLEPQKLESAIPVEPGGHSWAAKLLPESVHSAKEQRCLAAGVYFESRGESVKGQAAVAQVILNRVKNPAYPNSICGVVYQNENWRNRCQFSFACDGHKDRITEPEHWQKAQEVAQAVTDGTIWLPEVGSSTHYYADYVKPGWARRMQKMKKIGRHIFFRTRGGGWS